MDYKNKYYKYKKKYLDLKKDLDGGSKCVIEGKINTFRKLTAKDLKKNINACLKGNIDNGVKALLKVKEKANKAKIPIIKLLYAEFTLKQLLEAGYSKEEIRDGIKPWELKLYDQTCTYIDLKELGFTAQQIYESMTSPESLSTHFTNRIELGDIARRMLNENKKDRKWKNYTQLNSQFFDEGEIIYLAQLVKNEKIRGEILNNIR